MSEHPPDNAPNPQPGGAGDQSPTLLHSGGPRTISPIPLAPRTSASEAAIYFLREGRFEDYELIEKIAQGGMGEVFKARQISLNRMVALKRIRAQAQGQEDSRRRFRTEAEAAARLNHPNIVPIYEIGEQEGDPFFTMRFIEGQSLAAWAQERRRDTPAEVRVLQREAAAIMAKAARALHHAHQHGVLHRDIKPGNILLDIQGEPQVTDFGLAKIAESASDLTQTQTVLGTPSYMAPEQAGGKSRSVTTAADIYGAGAVLYHLVAGAPPFQGETALEVVMKVVNEEPPSLRSSVAHVDPGLESICLKCLEKDPARRYCTAEAVAEDLERWLRHEPLAAHPISWAGRLSKWARRRPAVAALLAALLATGTVGLGMVIWQWQEARRNETQALDALYAADLNLAYQAFNDNRYHQADRALERQSHFSDGRERRNFEWHYLKGQLGNLDGTSVGKHRFSVGAIEWIPHSQWFASIAADGIKIWDDAQGRELFQFEVLQHDTLAVSPDGQWLASGGRGTNNLMLWHLPSRSLKKTLQLPSLLVRSIKFSPQGNELAALCQLGEVVRIETVSGAVLETLPPPNSWKGAASIQGDLDYTRDGQSLVVAGSDDLKAFRYHLGSSQKPEPILIAFVAVSLNFSPDGSHVTIGGWGKMAAVYEWPAMKPVCTGKHQAWVSQAKFSRDGRWMVSAGADQTVKWFDWKRKLQMSEHLARIEVWAIGISPDGARVVAGGKDGSLWTWPLQRLRPLPYSMLNTPVMELIGLNNRQLYSPPDSDRLVFFTRDARVLSWDGQRDSKAATIVPNRAPWTLTGFSQGEKLAIGTLSGTVEVWNLRTIQRILEIRSGSASVIAVGASPDGRMLTVLHDDTSLVQHEITENSARQIATINATRIKSPAQFSADGFWLAGVDRNNQVMVWDLARQRLAARLPGHASTITCMQFSPNSRRLITGSEDQVVRIWRVDGWLQEGELVGPPVHSLAVSPDSRRIALASSGKESVTLWDLQTRDQVGVLPGPGDMLKSLTFSGDGRKIYAPIARDQLVTWETEFPARP